MLVLGEFMATFEKFLVRFHECWRFFGDIFGEFFLVLASFGRLLANFGECSSFCGDFDEFYMIF